MISLTDVVRVTIFLLIAAGVLGLLWFLIGFCETKLGGLAKVYDVIRVIFVFLVVLLLIGLLLAFANGTPLFRA